MAVRTGSSKKQLWPVMNTDATRTRERLEVSRIIHVTFHSVFLSPHAAIISYCLGIALGTKRGQATGYNLINVIGP